jgi:hypothetical protein
MALEHVQPGDLLTSQLINAIIDALGQLDAKIDKCCEEMKPKIFIDRIDPREQDSGQPVTIIGGGFLPDEIKDNVLIGGQPVTTFHEVTRSIIEAVVPPLPADRIKPEVEVIVRNSNGHTSGTMAVPVVQRPSPVQKVALVKLAPAGKVEAGLRYGMELLLVSKPPDKFELLVVMRMKTDGKTLLRTAITTGEIQKVEFEMPADPVTIETTLLKEQKAVDTQTYPFVVGESTPVPVDPNALLRDFPIR